MDRRKDRRGGVNARENIGDRHSRALRCAVGCLIDDAHYSEDLEGLALIAPAGASVAKAVGASIGRDLTRVDRRLLERLQDVHDYHDPALWPGALTDVADDLGLVDVGRSDV